MSPTGSTRRALVTGAAGAIGQAVLRDLTGRGWRVAGLDRAPQPASSLPGAGPVWLTADLTDEQAVAEAVDQLRHRWGGLDVLVNNAAVGPPRAPVSRETPGHLRSVLEVNLIAPLGLIQAVLPLLAAGHAPAVVQISSIGGTRAFRGNASYAASKGGLDALTRALALDLAGRGVRVNAVAPAMVHTAAWGGLQDAEAHRRAGLVPLRRPGTTAEVAAAVAFLAGPESSYITGTLLPVDGGLSIQAYSPSEEPSVADTVEQPPAGDHAPPGAEH